MTVPGSVARHLLVSFILLTVLCWPAVAWTPTYEMTLEVDAATGAYAGSLTLRYKNPAPVDLTEVLFRLYPNNAALFGSASLEVDSAAVDGGSVEPALYGDDTILLVPLPTSLAPGGEVKIDLVFSGHAADATPAFGTPSEYGVLTRSQDVLTLTSFYPVLAPYIGDGWAIDPPAPLGDAWFADAASYEVTLIVAPDTVVVPVADASTPEPDGRVRLSYTRTAMRDFPLAFLGEGRTPLEARVGETALRTWFASAHGEAAHVALDRATAALDIYGALFGLLPYASLDIVEAPLQRAAGVEYSGLFFVASANAAAPRDPFFDVIISHETAHEWFYASVGSDPMEEPWLDEALATYASNVFLSLIVSEASAQTERAAWASVYDRAKQAHPDLAVTSAVYDFPDSETYASFVYSGGALELDALRQEMGDDVFFAALREYASSYHAAIATGADLCESFAAAGGSPSASVLCGGEASASP